MTDTPPPQAMPNTCEHHYGTHILGGHPIHVPICTLCRTPDWNDLAEQAAALQEPLKNRLRLAHQARRAKEHQLDGIRRALCDVGVIEDDDPYGHADLEDVVRQAFTNQVQEEHQHKQITICMGLIDAEQIGTEVASLLRKALGRTPRDGA